MTAVTAAVAFIREIKNTSAVGQLVRVTGIVEELDPRCLLCKISEKSSEIIADLRLVGLSDVKVGSSVQFIGTVALGLGKVLQLICCLFYI